MHVPLDEQQLTGVPRKSTSYGEEIFGPEATVIPVAGLDEALAVGDLGFRLSLFGRCETSCGDSRSGEDLGRGGGLSDRCGSAIDVVPVEVLVLGVPLSGSLVIGAAEFLDPLV